VAEDIIWGLEASPFLLKLEAMLRYRQRPFRRLPLQGRRLENLVTYRQLTRARKRGEIGKYPRMEAGLDEYPAVPFYRPAGGTFQYDTSAIARWLDDESQASTLFPSAPGLHFIAGLLDDAFDEFGLYMVHHKRWVSSARDTGMPEFSAREMSRLLPRVLSNRLLEALPRRQVRRCPYLFSVAPEGFDAGVAPARTPPSRQGFPPTHGILDSAWRTYVLAVDECLRTQPFLLGERFTVADASAYGQLSMNLIDPTVAEELGDIAPRTLRWLLDIRDGGHVKAAGELRLTDALAPLLEAVMNTFAPLMAQNQRAWEKACQDGQTLFNEKAFNRGEALYEGELLGQPFRAVAKTFQVPVWRDLCHEWQRLEQGERNRLQPLLPRWELFEGG